MLTKDHKTALKAPLLINGAWVQSKTESWLDNKNPANNETIGLVPLATEEEGKQAIISAKEAYISWREVPPPERCRVFQRFLHLLLEHKDSLAKGITQEQGKTLADAHGDIQRGIEVVEYSLGAPSLLMGETVENVSKGIDCISYSQPLGVCVGITPFNFPAMIPLWMIPLAITLGNTFVLKPSEQTPLTANRIGELLLEAGLPNGVLNIVHGGKDVVQNLCDHPDVQAISFVGSAKTGHQVYDRATKSGKRCQALLGAKNHAVVMPDANKEKALNAIAGAAFGASGQRCMALSVAVFVGSSAKWIDDLVEKSANLRVGNGKEDVDLGPLISNEAKKRVENCIEEASNAGIEILIDGREVSVPNSPKGFYVGPTILKNAPLNSNIYLEEIFGPVLIVLTVDTLEEALKIVNENPYGNGTAIFTESGKAARTFTRYVEVGQVGVNIPIPVPLPFFSFTGWKGSIRGDINAYGKHGVRFYTRTKTVTTKWQGGESSSLMNTTINL